MRQGVSEGAGELQGCGVLAWLGSVGAEQVGSGGCGRRGGQMARRGACGLAGGRFVGVGCVSIWAGWGIGRCMCVQRIVLLSP